MTQSELDARYETGIKRTGTYMLSGWVLMNEVCKNQGCNFPTLRTKDRSQIVCCLCDDPKQPYPVPSNVSTRTNEPAVAALTADEDAELEILNKESNDDDGNDNEDEDKDEGDGQGNERGDGQGGGQDPELMRDIQRRREQSELASKLLGQKMLQGWTLLQDECQRCVGNQKLCVLCNGNGNGESAAPEVVESKVAVASAAEPALTTADDASVHAGHKRPFVQIADEHHPVSITPSVAVHLNHRSSATTELPLSVSHQSRQTDTSHASIQIQQSIGSLVRKLGVLTANLESATNATDISSISTAIAAIGSAIASLQAANR
eukprot:jgi/Hompol1/7021/HPOL_000286-RA